MKTVLDAALAVAAANGGEVTGDQISTKLVVQTRVGHKRVLNLLSDLYRQGRLVRLRQGVYGPVPASGLILSKREIMKNVVNIRKRVTVADLMEMAGVGKDYAREWLKLMTDNGALRKEQAPGQAATWFRVRELELTDDTVKAERLREMRRRRRERMEGQLAAIETAVTELRNLITTWEDGVCE
jgi:hypothetical protein